MSETFIMRRFDSIHKFLDAAKKGANKRGASHMHRDADGYGENWTGTDNFEQAYNYAKYGGWQPDSVVRLRNLFDDMVPRLRKFTEMSYEVRPEVHGFQVDVPMFLAGEPEHMFEFVPDEHQVTKRALCLIVGHSISAGNSSKELFIRGQALIALVRALNLMGFDLEIWSEESLRPGWSGRGNNDLPDNWACLTRLHAAGSTMDESAVEFAVGNPSWLRRLLFGLQEGEPVEVREKFGFKNGEGYGSCMPIQHADLVGADIQLNLGERWFGESSWGDDDEDTAKRGIMWVAGQLKKLGVISEDAELEWD